MCHENVDLLVELPAIQTFDRPLWAYDHLPNGWALLRRHLFGDTPHLLQILEGYGHTSVSGDTLRQLIHQLGINPQLLAVFLCGASYQTAVELATWYLAWEDRRFEAYCQAAQQQERRHFGGG